MQFKYPWLFFLLIPLFWLLWQQFKSRSQNKIFFPFSHRRQNTLPRLTNWRIKLPYILRALAFTLAILALARPQTSSSNSRRLAQGIDIMIAFDVSRSMTIEDYRPNNRLEVAKAVVKNFIEGRSDDRIGFLMFSGESVTLCPPTLDYEVLLRSVENADVGQLKDGTAIGDALATAVARLKDSNAKSRVIILLTDGDNNAGAIAPLTAGSVAAGYGIKVYAIAFGKDGMAPMPVYEDFFGQKRKAYANVSSSINPDLLKKISEETKGKFYRAQERDSLAEVFHEIDGLERTKIETKQRIRWDEHFAIFLFPALLTLLIELFLSRFFLRVLPN